MFAVLDADNNILTGYVPDESYHDTFENELDRFGYLERMISPYYCGKKKVTHNRIFFASQLPLIQGHILPPARAIDGVRNNIFHIDCNSVGIIGLRMPLLSGDEKMNQIPIISHPWWEWVIKIAREKSPPPIHFHRELQLRSCENNRRRQFTARTVCTGRLDASHSEGLSHEEFYHNPNSKGTTIDHAFISSQLVLKNSDLSLRRDRITSRSMRMPFLITLSS